MISVAAPSGLSGLILDWTRVQSYIFTHEKADFLVTAGGRFKMLMVKEDVQKIQPNL